MGCGGSSASDPSDEKIDWNKDGDINDEFQKEEGRKRKRFNKTKGEAEDASAPANEREFDLFEGADAGSGEKFMAVRPYEGAIAEPKEHNEVNKSEPDVKFELDYVYGYRAEDSRMNCYYNCDGQICYMTAALGIVLDQGSNTQKFFGGGQTDNKSKKVASNANCHTNDITAMGMSACRKYCATGQNGSTPVAFTWDSCTGKKNERYVLKKGCREVTAISICPENKHVALVDNHNDHNLFIYKFSDGSIVKKDKTGPDKIYHCAWSQKKGDACVATAGAKHFAVWDLMAAKWRKRKGLYGGNGKPTSHCCVTWDDAGNAFSGGANSNIYCWEGQNLGKTYDVHGQGFVCAISWCEGKIISGAKDGKVVVSDPST